MHIRKKILAICGSTRSESVNLHLLNRNAEMYETKMNFSIFTQIDLIPHFNPDLDTATPPEAVSTFRRQIEEADGILICTPEYVYSLPGSLKNAIEWTVSTTLFTDKPTALITAASSGQKTHEALSNLMFTIGAKIGPTLLIQAPKTKVSIDGIITDEPTLISIRQLMNTFMGILSDN